MDATTRANAIEGQEPALRDDIDGIKFRTLAPGITTHPLIRSGRPCIVGTGLKVSNIVVQQNFWQQTPAEIAKHFDIAVSQVNDALNYYAAHTDYIDTDIALAGLNHEQWEEAQDGTLRDLLLSRRKSVT